MNHWLVKQEPESYSWTDFLKEGRTVWTGVRNFQARNNLRAMRKSDLVLFYHSGSEKQIVGVATVAREAWPDPTAKGSQPWCRLTGQCLVAREAWPDPTAKEGDWSCVELVPVKTLRQPVALAAVKSDLLLKDIPLVRHSRLSVSPLTAPQFARLLRLAKTENDTQE